MRVRRVRPTLSLVEWMPWRLRDVLLPGNRQALHDLDRLAGKYREVWVVLEHARRSIVRLRLHEAVARHVVLEIRDAGRGRALGFTERTALRHDGRLMLRPPVHPRLDAGSLARL